MGVVIVMLDFMVQAVSLSVSRGAKLLIVKRILEIVLTGVKTDTWA